MKKLIFFILLFTSVLTFSELKDGTYSVEKKYDANYATFVKLIVKNNKVIGAQYDKKILKENYTQWTIRHLEISHLPFQENL